MAKYKTTLLTLILVSTVLVGKGQVHSIKGAEFVTPNKTLELMRSADSQGRCCIQQTTFIMAKTRV
jgi:hypothetical protein